MKRLLFVLACLMLTSVVQGQRVLPQRSPALKKVFGFEAEHTGEWPWGWGGGPPGTVVADERIVHGGRWSARFERSTDSPNSSSTISIVLPMDFSGRSIEWRGYLRTDEVSDYVGLWLREEDEAGSEVAFGGMQSRQVRGTNDWKQYSITAPVRAEGRRLVVGVLLAGTGRAWVADLELLVDGKPIWEAPTVTPSKTVFDSDHEFDAGSGIALGELSAIQVQNLRTLGKVWGFLKYHHPQVTSGQRHWDYDLFRVLPVILAARDRQTANAALLQWITTLGPVAPCNPCAKLQESTLHLRPESGWLADTTRLGPLLSQTLQDIHLKGPQLNKQFYVSLVFTTWNPSFDHESAYRDLKLPDAGFQLLGLYRFWNMIVYWYPYRDVIGEDWDKVLIEFIPRITLAKTAEAYQREMMALIARIHDSHANLWSSLQVRPPTGNCQLPVNVRFIENVPVVTGYSSEGGAVTRLLPGDVITHLDGVAVSKLVGSWLPYYAASNDASRLRDVARFMTNGACGKATVRIRRDSAEMELTAERVAASSLKLKATTHDLPGDTFRLLSPEVAYLKLSSVKANETARYIERAAATKGLIIDIRNYPSEFVVFALGSALVEKETEFARSTRGDPSNPGAFHFGESRSLSPQKPHYAGKVLILVDEISQSQAEYTTMALRAAPHSTVIGSTTAGADGNVSDIPLPGGLRSVITGNGVFYPDKRPTQRVGILPDIEVKPTIAGIRAGRDEVLEAALRQILGAQVPAAEIERLAKPAN